MNKFFVFLVLTPILLTAQSKKEAIELLTNQVDSLIMVKNQLVSSLSRSNYSKDSLNNLLLNERQQYASNIAAKHAELTLKETENKALNASISELNQRMAQLNLKIGIASDSLKLERESRAMLIEQIQKNQKDLQEMIQLRAEIQKLKNSEIDYKSIEIDGTLWMIENLAVKKFKNGDPIPHATDADSWENAAVNAKPAWCFYDFNPANEAKYGILYNYYVIADERGIGNEGWNVPSQG